MHLEPTLTGDTITPGDLDELYRFIVSAMADGVIVYDAGGRIIFCNPSAERILGIRAEEMLACRSSESLWDVIREDGSPVSPDEYPARVALQTGQQGVARVLGLKGPREEVIWVSVKSEPLVRRGDPVPYGAITTFSDITRQRQAELALMEREELFRTLVENQSEGIGIVDLQERFIFTNRAGEEIFGTGAGGLNGRSLHDFVAPESVAFIEEETRARTTGKRSQYELEIIRESDKEKRTILVSANPQVDSAGQVTATFGVFSDITERIRVEKALEENEARLRLTFDQAPIGAEIVSLEGRIIQVNEAFCRLLGYQRSELIGRYAPELTHPDHCEKDKEHGLLMLAGKIDRYSTEKRYIGKDGREIWAHMTVRCAADPGGRPLYFLTMVEDITERKRVEAETARLQQQFLQSQKMESVGRLAGGVAHDFNNLLTIINGYAAALAAGLKPGDPSHMMISEIFKAGESAAALVKQLLAFSRKQVLRRELVDLNDMICGMDKLLLRLVGEDVELITTLCPALAPVLGDRNQMEQVIMNLSINARDAMPQGGTLTIETDHVTCRNSCPTCLAEIRPGRYVRITVRDTGIGMDEETRQNLFEPFFTTKEIGQGTGLGLATVHGIVMQSGGHIDVESNPGGTFFHLYLPAAEARAETKTTTAAPRVQGGTETILLVEDQVEVRRFVESILSQHGYRVLPASSGEEALEKCPAERIDLLLTDVVMPKMSGSELARRIRASYPSVKVLFMSGYSNEMLTEHLDALASAAFLQKPFRKDELAEKVREVLGPARKPASAS